MAISYVGGASGASVGSTTADLTISLTALSGGSNSSPSTGDLVVVTVVTGHSNDAPTLSLVSTGYTPLTQLDADDTYDCALRVFYKVMGGTPDTSVVVTRTNDTAAGLAVAVQVFRGVDTATPMDVTPVPATGIDIGQPDPAPITPTTAGSWIVVCCGAVHASITALTLATLSNVVSAGIGETVDPAVAMGDYTSWTSGEYNPAAAGGGSTSSFASWCAYTLALRIADDGEVDGDLNVTLGAMTLASGSTVAIAGASAATLGAMTLASAGAVAVAAESAMTLGAMTLSATYAATTEALLNADITLGAMTVASAGAAPIAGASSITLGALALSSTFEAGFPERLAAAAITLGAMTLSATGGCQVICEATIALASMTLVASSEEIIEDGIMGIESFVAGYDGALGDQVHNFLLANTTGTDATWTTSDLWMKFFTELGYVSGTLLDRNREFLIDYLVVADTGQTLQDLWGLVTDPYTPAP